MWLSTSSLKRKLIGKLLCDFGFECDGEVLAILVNESLELEEFGWENSLPQYKKRVLEDLRANQGHSLLFLNLFLYS